MFHLSGLINDVKIELNMIFHNILLLLIKLCWLLCDVSSFGTD